MSCLNLNGCQNCCLLPINTWSLNQKYRISPRVLPALPYSCTVSSLPKPTKANKDQFLQGRYNVIIIYWLQQQMILVKLLHLLYRMSNKSNFLVYSIYIKDFHFLPGKAKSNICLVLLHVSLLRFSRSSVPGPCEKSKFSYLCT